MKRPTSRQGVLALTAVMGVALLAPTSAGAVEGTFSGEAEATQLYVDALNFAPVGQDLSLAEVSVASTDEQVDTAGLGEGIQSRAFGQNLSAALGGEGIPLEELSVTQTAPPDNAEPTSATAIDLSQAAPLLTGGVLNSTAWARDPAAVECPDDGRAVVAESVSTTTNLGVLDLGEFQDGMGPLVSVEALGEGTLESRTGTYVGSAGEVITEASAQSAAVNIAGELELQVLEPTLTATATGTPGGASVDYAGRVMLNGEQLVGTSEQTLDLTVLEPILPPLDEMLLNEVFGPLDEVLTQVLGPFDEATADAPILGDIANYDALTEDALVSLIDQTELTIEDLAEFLQPTVSISVAELDSSTSEDGTQASGSISLLRIELTLVNTLAEATDVDPLLTVDLMPLAASATAPAGGLNCGDVADDDPFANLRKDASTAVVAPGDTFDYTITVPNDAGCTVTDVTVTDVITDGPDGFTITSASDGGQIDGNSVTWTVDEIAPGGSESFTLTVQVPNDAAGGETFTDEVTAEGDCDGAPATGQFLLPDIPRVETGGAAPDSLPRTGGGFALLGVAGLAAASGLWRRR